MKKFVLIIFFLIVSFLGLSRSNIYKHEIDKIPILEAIESENYYTFSVQNFFGEMNFKLKITNFEKISQNVIDSFKYLEFIDNGILWIMKIEVINIDKQPLESGNVSAYLTLIDKDGFIFPGFYNDELCYNSEYAEETGLIRFTGWSNVPALNPKINVKGAVAFLLPDEESIYYLTIEDGKIFN